MTSKPKKKKFRELKQIMKDARKNGHTHVSHEEFAYAFRKVKTAADNMCPCHHDFTGVIHKNFWDLLA